MILSLWRYANIIFFKTYANLKAEVSKTYMGCLWWVLEPLINTAIYYLIFTFITQGHFEKSVAFVFVGNVIYGWFASSINSGANAVISNAGLIQHVYLPKLIFPFITICNLSWKFLFSFIILLPLLWFNQSPINITYLALPVLLILHFIIVVGISLPLAMLMPYFPDGKTVLSAFLNISMWLSGVFYSIDAVPSHLRFCFYANPIASLIEAFRSILINGQWPHWIHLIAGTFTGAICWIIGLLILRKLDRKVTKIAM